MNMAMLEAMVGRFPLFCGKLHCLEKVDSTSTRLKELAEAGAPEGTVLLAEEQTAGRGTGGRQFWSPAGTGVYLSVLLRPGAVPPEELLTLTGRAAVAVRRAIAAACGAPCRIKWLNDIYLNGRKICGILAELGPDWVVLGVGINVGRADFTGQGLEGIATSLAAEGWAVEREALCAAVLQELERMYSAFPAGRGAYLAEYRAHCLTLGKQVEYGPPTGRKQGSAAEIDENFALLVRGPRGVEPVPAGRVELKEDGA